MRRLAPAVLLVGLLALLVPATGQGAIYWAGQAGLGIANLDGSQRLAPLPDGHYPAFGANFCGIAVDGGHIYWAEVEGGTIGRANLDGTLPDNNFITGLADPCGVDVDAGYVYWADRTADTIGRARLDGSAVQPDFIVGASMPTGVAVDAGHIYWSNEDVASIGRAEIGGGNVEQEFVPKSEGLALTGGIAVSAGHVYWGDFDLASIGRAQLDGGHVEPKFIAGAGDPWDLATSGSHLYWADRGDLGEGSIGRATLAGTEVLPSFLGGIRATGVAVDARVLPAPVGPPRPSDYLRFGRISHRADGSVRVIVLVPARGSFTVDSPGLAWSMRKGRAAPQDGGALRWRLTLRPGKGAKGAAIRRKLSRHGRAAIVLRATYTQEGRLPVQRTKRVVFRR